MSIESKSVISRHVEIMSSFLFFFVLLFVFFFPLFFLFSFRLENFYRVSYIQRAFMHVHVCICYTWQLMAVMKKKSKHATEFTTGHRSSSLFFLAFFQIDIFRNEGTSCAKRGPSISRNRGSRFRNGSNNVSKRFDFAERRSKPAKSLDTRFFSSNFRIRLRRFLYSEIPLFQSFFPNSRAFSLIGYVDRIEIVRNRLFSARMFEILF